MSIDNLYSATPSVSSQREARMMQELCRQQVLLILQVVII